MKFKHCNFCDLDTWHNPLKPPATKGMERGYRCTQCGQPRRAGRKNFGVRLAPGSRVIMQAGS